MIRYFDASALVKRYVAEPFSEEVGLLLAGGTASTARLSWVEVASALARRTRQGDLSESERDRALASLARDAERILVIELTAALVLLATDLLKRHTLRAADAIQLASALHLGRRTGRRIGFVAFDQRLNRAGAEEGLELLTLR